MQEGLPTGPRLATLHGALRALQSRGRLTANLGGHPMGRLRDYRHADNLQQLQRRLEAYVRPLAPLEFSDEPYADAPSLSKFSTTEAKVLASILEQHAYSSRQHFHT